MKIIIIKIIISFFIIFWNLWVYATNINDETKIINENTWNWKDNKYIEEINNNWEFFQRDWWWEKWLKNLILNIARDLRVIVFTIVLIIVVVMVFKLIFADNTEEEQKKLKMWIIWASVWIVVMQTAYSAYKILFDQWVWKTLWERLAWDLVQPFILLLTTIASFAFLAVWVYAFYKLVTANWDEEKISKWKHAIIHAIIWFIIIKASAFLVKNTFEPNCNWWSLIQSWWITICENISENAKMIMIIINWMNTFIRLLVILMTIYAWFLYMTSSWDEEKQWKAKKIIIYVWIWLLILFANYLILTFFISSEVSSDINLKNWS